MRIWEGDPGCKAPRLSGRHPPAQDDARGASTLRDGELHGAALFPIKKPARREGMQHERERPIIACREQAPSLSAQDRTRPAPAAAITLDGHGGALSQAPRCMGSPRHISSRSEPASLTYTPSGTSAELDKCKAKA